VIEFTTLNALTDNFVYVATAAGAAVVVDPGEAAPVLSFLSSRGLKLNAILLTHHHPDHVAGVAELLTLGPVPVYCSRADRPRIPGATRALDDGESFDVLGSEVEVIATPGHTSGHITYVFPREGAAFTGDTLFSGGCGRLFEGTAEQMFASLKKLAALPPETRVYFGHEYTLNNLAFIASRRASPELETYAAVCRAARSSGQPTTPSTVAVELKINPFLNATSVEDFREWREARNHW
jgi:hydroxyacylglutathione hydrolase